MKLHRLAIVLAGATYVLLLVGGLVHPTGSSLACPDWPLCHGSALPRMVGGVLYEHTHRLVATSVGLLTLILFVSVLRSRREDRRLVRLSLAALLLVVVQGGLGGATVLLQLPDAISISHLGVSMAFFALTILLAFRTRPSAEMPRVTTTPAARLWVRLAVVLVYCQIVLGAFVRHVDGAALVCHMDVVLCLGQLWPDWDWTGKIQMLHRMNAVLILVTTVTMAVLAHARAQSASGGEAVRTPGRVRILAIAAPCLVVIQIALGVWSLRSLLDAFVVTAHLGVAALLFADLVSLALLTRAAPGEAVDAALAAAPEQAVA